jgi:hypothetical protein
MDAAPPTAQTDSEPSRIGAMPRHPLLQAINVPRQAASPAASDLDYIRAAAATFASRNHDFTPPSLAPDRALTEGELEALHRVGLLLGPTTQQCAARARRQSAHVFFDLFVTGLTVADVAVMLGVSTSTIRQRIRNRTFLKLSAGREYRLPALQFHENHELPGLREILRAFPQAISTIEALSWLVTPNVDLLGEEMLPAAPRQPVSPRDYLLETGNDTKVIRLAGSLRAD